MNVTLLSYFLSIKKNVILGVTQRIKTTFGTRASLTRPWTHIGIQWKLVIFSQWRYQHFFRLYAMPT